MFLSLGVMLNASPDNDKAISFDQLPHKAQAFITHYFSKEDISYAKKDVEIFDKDYDVYFVDGNKISFKKNGEWKDIECKRSEIPQGIIPNQIHEYVSANYANVRIIEIEYDSKKYEIKLSNNKNLIFNKKGNLLHYDY